MAGKTRIKLAPQIKPGQLVSLQVVATPREQDLVFVSPWDARAIVPPFENEAENFVPIVLAKRGDRAFFEFPKVLAERINAATAPKSVTEKVTEEKRRSVLEEVSREYGLEPDEVDRAIRAWGEKAKDPYEKGLASLYAGDYAEASYQHSESLDRSEESLARSEKKMGFYLNNLAEAYRAQGRYEEAEPLYRRSLDIWEKELGPEHPNVAASLNNLAEVYRAQGRYEEAEPLYRRSLDIREKELGPEHPDVAASLNNLAEVYRAQGRYEEAEAVYQRAESIWEEAQAKEAKKPPKQIEIGTRALSDKPSEVDLLNYADYADALADFIENENTEKPITIGIDAPWGMGKTTLMRMIKERLVDRTRDTKHNERYRLVWFNAWKYDQEDSLWAALAIGILSQVRTQFGLWQRTKLWMRLNWKRFDWEMLRQSVFKSVAYFLGICLLGAIALFAASASGNAALQEFVNNLLKQDFEVLGGLGFVTALYAFGKEVCSRLSSVFDLKVAKYVRQPNYRERIGFLDEFREDFRRVIDVLTDSGRWPLVVFIDDLDRCAPPKPAEIIEALNTLLDAEHCVFVIGMDAQAVAASIEAKYRDLEQYLKDASDPGRLSLGQRFLEKIVQINFRIPKVDMSRVDYLVNSSLSRLKEVPSAKPTEKKVMMAEQLIRAEQREGKSLAEASHAVQKARSDLSSREVKEARQRTFARSFDDSEIVRNAIRKASPMLGLNPRKIKRFINIYRLQALIANRRGLFDNRPSGLDCLAKCVILANRWPEIMNYMTGDSGYVARLLRAAVIEGMLLENERSPDEKQKLQPEFDALSSDLKIKRFVKVSELIQLLQDLTEIGEDFLDFIQLTKVTTGNQGGTVV